MPRFSRVLGVLMIAAWSLAAPLAHAQDGISVSHPWVRATASPLITTGGVYAEIGNGGTVDDHLVAASTPAAAMTALHTTTQENGMMMMKDVPGFDLKAGATLRFQPGGNHIMLMGLKAPLKQGDHLTLTLTFAKAGTITVEVPVVAVDALNPP